MDRRRYLAMKLAGVLVLLVLAVLVYLVRREDQPKISNRSPTNAERKTTELTVALSQNSRAPIAGARPEAKSKPEPVPSSTSDGTGPTDRERLEGRLLQSGPSDAPWTVEVGRTVETVLGGDTLVGLFLSRSTDCYAEGCIVRLVFAPEVDFGLAQEAVGGAEGLGKWSRVVTRPEKQSDGTTESVLVVFRPPTEHEIKAAGSVRRKL